MNKLLTSFTAALAITALSGCAKHDTANTSDENTFVSGDYAGGNSDQFDNTFDGNVSDATPTISNSGNTF